SGHSLAPAVAAAFVANAGSLIGSLEAAGSLWAEVIAAEPVPGGLAGEGEIDRVLRAVADFVDLKSPFLVAHSSGVAALGAAAGQELGLLAGDVVTIRRAGWLHDIGRVGVSSSIWAQPSPLTAHQWEQVRLHPYYADRVLGHTAFLARLAAVASAH